MNKSVEERFWSKVRISPEYFDCWLWRGTIDPKGYGRFKIGGKAKRVHRIAFEYLVGPIPPDMQIDHLCRQRNCVNPRHLELVSNRENTVRGENCLLKPDKTSQFIGVYWRPRSQKWVAQIRIQGKKIYLGTFAEEEKAAEAYEKSLRDSL